MENGATAARKPDSLPELNEGLGHLIDGIENLNNRFERLAATMRRTIQEAHGRYAGEVGESAPDKLNDAPPDGPLPRAFYNVNLIGEELERLETIHDDLRDLGRGFELLLLGAANQAATAPPTPSDRNRESLMEQLRR